MPAGALQAVVQLLFLACTSVPDTPCQTCLTGRNGWRARAQELDTAWTPARPHLRALRDLFRGRAGAEPPSALGAREARAALAALRGAADGLWSASCRVLDDAGFSLLKGCQARAPSFAAACVACISSALAAGAACSQCSPLMFALWCLVCFGSVAQLLSGAIQAAAHWHTTARKCCSHCMRSMCCMSARRLPSIYCHLGCVIASAVLLRS